MEIMYQNAIYICSSWYSKFCWFPVKKCRCQQNSRGVSHDSYIFWVFFTEGITAKFHHCGICVTHFREGGGCFLSQPPSSPHICEQPQKSPSWIGLLWCNFYNGIFLDNTYKILWKNYLIFWIIITMKI